MEIIALLCVCAVALGYTDVEPIDVDALIKNPEETKQYMDCFLDNGPCKPTMARIKGHMVEAISDACQNCSPAEKHEGEEFFFNVLLEYPEYIAPLRQKYDPEGKYFNKFAFELSKF